MIIFRIEDENGLDRQMRIEIGNIINNIDSKDADAYLANLIRKEINGSKERNLYSCSKALGVVLFKYNFVADNPINIFRVYYNNYVEIETYDPEVKTKILEFNLSDLNSPIARTFQIGRAHV